MPRPIGSTSSTPSYRLHKPSGQAVVTLDGKDRYLGPYKSKVSKAEYDRLVAEWLANGRRLKRDSSGDLHVNELLNAFWKHARKYYAGPRGQGELRSIKGVIKTANRLYGTTLVAEFGPAALKTVREEMIRLGWSRKYINVQVKRLRRIFKWGVAEESLSVPPDILQRLEAVEPLRKGKTTAPERKRVRPVADDRVDAVLPHVSPQVKAMIQLQRLAGMRPGEVVIMRGCDIDMSKPVWRYTPETHKTEGHDIERCIPLGPRAQEIIKPFLKQDDPTAYLFAPADAERHRHQQQRQARKSKVQPSQVKRGRRAARHKRRRAPGDRYDVPSYRRAINRACELAFGMPAEYRVGPEDRARVGDTPELAEVKAKLRAEKAAKRAAWHRANSWHPHQIRHTAATAIRKRFGLEAAKVILGHASSATTEIYAETDLEPAERAMGEVG